MSAMKSRIQRVDRGRLLGILVLGLSIAGRVVAAPETEPAAMQENPADGILAVVNGTPVYLEDLESTLGSLHSGADQAERGDFDVARLLERVVDDILLAGEARALGMADEPPIPERLDAIRTTMAVARLERAEISDKVVVTDEDVEAYFKSHYTTATFRMVTLAAEAEARDLLTELDAETDFEAVARERSVDQYSARGGLVEEIARIDLPRTLAAAIFEAAPGEILGPIETRLGWALVRIDSLHDADPERLESVERKLQQIIGFGRAEALRKSLATELWEMHDVTIDQAALDAIRCERLPDGRLSPGIDDPKAVVATVGESRILAGGMAQTLLKRWAGVKDEQAALAVKPLALDRLIREELFEVEALARGYGAGPEIDRTLAARESQMLAARYLREILAPQIKVPEEERQKFYDEHLEDYSRPPRVNVRQITVVEEAEAERLAALLREGADIGWLAREHSIDRFKDAGGARGWMEPVRGLDPFSDALYAAQPGDVIGPMGPEGNRMVLQVAAREEQGYVPYEEVAEGVAQSLARVKFEQKKAEVLSLLRSRSEIVVNDEAVESLNITGTLEDAEAQGHGAH